ncbi:MAG: ATP-binding cassette domain-containing protein [Lachnospiraceae bacterium]
MVPDAARGLVIRIRKRGKEGAPDLDVTASFTKESGSILGDSDSGRDLLFRCLAGLDVPDEGEIRLNGKVLFDSMAGVCLPPALRRVGYLAEDAALFSGLTVLENITLALEAGNEREKAPAGKHALAAQADSILTKVGLDGLGGALPEHLSRSQKVLALFARMMAAEPALVLLDDPFRGLNGYEKAAVMQKVRAALQSARVPSLFAGADRDEVYAMGEEILVLHRRKGEGVRGREAFFQRPETLAGAILSGCENIAKVTLLDAHHVRVPDWGLVLLAGETGENNGDEAGEDHSEEKQDAKGQEEKSLPKHPGKVLPPDLAAVGIRAEDLLIQPPKEKRGIISLPVREGEIREERKNFVLTFRPGEHATKKLSLFIPKSEMNKNDLAKVEKVCLPEEKILWLRDPNGGRIQ